MRKLKREYNSTMVAMTDATGKTGCVDYRDKHIPTDEELVIAAEKYGLRESVKFTITSVIGVKVKFVADIIDRRLVRSSDEKVDMRTVKDMREKLYLSEKEKLTAFLGMDLYVPIYMEHYGIDVGMVDTIVAHRRKGAWVLFGDEYLTAMRNCVIAEKVMEVGV